MIRAWRLQKSPPAKQAFATFGNGERLVVISGLGKIAMAAAVAYTLARLNETASPLLINLGIAGHASLPVGEIGLSHKIIDAESGRVFYPQLPFNSPCASYSLVTQSAPCTDYRDDNLYDMEAAGFYEIAGKFSTAELSHVCKIVSDNKLSPIGNIHETQVEELIEKQLETIESLVGQLISLRQNLPQPKNDQYRELLANFHFSVTGAVQLQQLLQRWSLLKGNETPDWRQIKGTNGKAVLAWLESQLKETEFSL